MTHHGNHAGLPYAVLVLVLLVSSCVQTEYVGKSYSATRHVDIYFAASDVTQRYETMGEIKAEAPDALSFEQMEQQLIQDAMARGADGLIVGGMETVTTGSSTWSSGDDEHEDPHYYVDRHGHLKRSGEHDHWSGNSYTTVQKDKVLTGHLIKYR